MDSVKIREDLAALRTRLDGRAAGAWAIEGDRLILVAFNPAPDLPAEIARGFEAATQSVALGPSPFGIVGAATSGRVAVSIAAELPPGAGSGLWLRAFAATRSVAVPIVDGGDVLGVVSVALGPDPGAEVVAAMIREQGWRTVT